MIQIRTIQLYQGCSRRGADKTIQNHRNPRPSGRHHGAGDGTNFPAPYLCQLCQRIICADPPYRHFDHPDFVGQRLIRHPGAGSDPIAGRASKQRMGQGGRRGGITNTHFPQAQQIGVAVHVRHALPQGFPTFGFGQGGASGEIRSGAVQV